jgi:hypothetical protein
MKSHIWEEILEGKPLLSEYKYGNLVGAAAAAACRCCLAVHHCGVGTCGAVLRAGIASVPCPVMLDQPFLAHRLVEAGVACKPLQFHKITADVRHSTGYFIKS